MGVSLGDALDGRVGEPGEDGAEVVAHRDLEPAAAFNHRQDGGQEQAGHRGGSGRWKNGIDPGFHDRGKS